MPFMTRTADLLQDALEGGSVDASQFAALATTARRAGTVGLSARFAPDPGFVSALGQRLLAEAATLSSRQQTSTARTSAARSVEMRRTGQRVKPVVFVVGRGLPRAIAGVAASALAVGAVVGVAARGAVPGAALYPVRQILDSAAVRLAASDFDKGMTLLAQGREHIRDAREMVGRGTPDPEALDVGLSAAIDSVSAGRVLLLRSFAETGDTQAVRELQDFSTTELPGVDALRERVPASSLPLLEQLRALLGGSWSDRPQQLAACESCAGADTAALDDSRARRPAQRPAAVPLAAAASTTATEASAAPSAVTGAAARPVAPATSAASSPLQSRVVKAAVAPATVTVPGATVTTAPRSTLPSAPRTSVSLASVSLGSVSLGSVSLGSVSLGPVSLGPVSLPPVSLGSVSLSSSVSLASVSVAASLPVLGSQTLAVPLNLPVAPLPALPAVGVNLVPVVPAVPVAPVAPVPVAVDPAPVTGLVSCVATLLTKCP